MASQVSSSNLNILLNGIPWTIVFGDTELSETSFKLKHEKTGVMHILDVSKVTPKGRWWLLIKDNFASWQVIKFFSLICAYQINIRGDLLDPENAKLVFDALAVNPWVREIDIKSLSLFETSASDILPLFTIANINYLTLSACELTLEHFDVIINGLYRNTTITTLNISENDFFLEGIPPQWEQLLIYLMQTTTLNNLYIRPFRYRDKRQNKIYNIREQLLKRDLEELVLTRKLASIQCFDLVDPATLKQDMERWKRSLVQDARIKEHIKECQDLLDAFDHIQQNNQKRYVTFQTLLLSNIKQ